MAGNTYWDRMDRFFAKQKELKQRSWELFFAGNRRRVRARKAKLAAAEGSHTEDDLKAIRERQGDQCVYCKTNLNGKGHRDHIVPLVSGGSNYPENLQWLCPRCSSSKGRKSEQQFLDELRALRNE